MKWNTCGKKKKRGVGLVGFLPRIQLSRLYSLLAFHRGSHPQSCRSWLVPERLIEQVFYSPLQDLDLNQCDASSYQF